MPNRKYLHLFFDLDNTLWDFDNNWKESLFEIYIGFNLKAHFTSFSNMVEQVESENLNLRNCLSKQISNEELIQHICSIFNSILNNKTALLPNTIETLEYLSPRYELHIITNGDKKSQEKKLINGKIKHYFTKLFFSDEIKSRKPNKIFFDYALKSSNSKKTKSLIIGDCWETDIEGAKNCGIDSIYFNTKNKVVEDSKTTEIKNLSELINIL